MLTVRDSKAHIASQLLHDVFVLGDTAIVDRVVSPDSYIQHNPLAPDGADALKYFSGAMRQQFPQAAFEPRRSITDGDLVLLHARYVMVPGTEGLAVFDLFRFEDGKIAEHWDIIQEVPATTASGNDMFATLSEPRTEAVGQRWFTAYNKRLVTEFFDQLLVRKDLTAIDTYLGAEYHQHNPLLSDGADGAKAGLGGYFERSPQLSVTRKRVMAEGDLVAVHSHQVDAPGERGRSVLDLFRVRDGKIVEHWDSTQDVPETAANDNTMF
ncbi:nuclear transport factor 2 family protein [Streptomyces brasiliscabiei]|uniref:Nuclear transport factor 2 family protein n=1 Tax=Streptomyces brasiliscabiei TaxID=2736302 RepID=A0ABU8GMM1_9ACTN